LSAWLHRITPNAYRGELHGYWVEVFYVHDHWHYAVFSPAPKQYTRICTRADSLQDGAAKARQWIEENVVKE
jgi:hypothetical protein